MEGDEHEDEDEICLDVDDMDDDVDAVNDVDNDDKT